MVRSASGGALALSGARLEPSGTWPAAILRDARLRYARRAPSGWGLWVRQGTRLSRWGL